MAGGKEIPVQVHLTGHVQPLDGTFRWYGRVSAHPEVTALLEAGAREVVVRVAREATGRLAELDPWGNVRLTGVGSPPF